MMKKFLVVLSVLFFAVSVSAADLNLSGSYNFKGINADFSKVYDVTEVPTAVHEASEYYEMDFDLTAKIVVNDKISITTVMEMVDRHLGQHVAGGQDIEVKRSYLTAKITDALTLDFGRMAGGTWATAFGDTEDHYDRIKAVYVTPVGVLLAVMEKNIENSTGWGTAQPEKTEEKDMDSLALGFITKAGPVNIKPLYKMVTNAGAAAAVPHDTDLAAMVLGVDGDFGMVAFEAEYISKTYSGDVEASVTGMFANVWYKADALKAEEAKKTTETPTVETPEAQKVDKPVEQPAAPAATSTAPAATVETEKVDEA